MTENKNKEEVEETPTEAVAESENIQQLSAEIESLKKQLVDASSKMGEYPKAG